MLIANKAARMSRRGSLLLTVEREWRACGKSDTTEAASALPCGLFSAKLTLELLSHVDDGGSNGRGK
jgi:hypothetical protein